MNGSPAVRVVLFDAVSSRAIRERRETGYGADACTDDGGAAVRAHSLHHALHRVRRFLARSAYRYREVIEQEILGAIQHFGRQAARIEPMQKANQLASVFSHDLPVFIPVSDCPLFGAR